jgi:hypothetical protein
MKKFGHAGLTATALAGFLLGTSANATTAITAATEPVPEENVIQHQQSAPVLGKALSGELVAGAPAGLNEFMANMKVEVLGIQKSALQTTMNLPATPDGPGAIEYYSFGQRIFGDSTYFTNDGFLEAKAGIAPVEVRIPFVIYPVGPMTLNVAGGVRFQAEVDGQLLPTLWINPVSNSSIETKINASASGAGFIEGYASLIVIRGGVGGQLDLLDGQLALDADFFFNGAPIRTSLSAMVTFLSGKLYAFADYFNIFKWSWDRFWEYDLFSWNGYCFSAGSLTCPK